MVKRRRVEFDQVFGDLLAMKSLRLGLFSALILFAGSAVAMAQQTVTITSDVNAYKGPSTASEFAGTVRANTPVTLDHCEANFCLVYYGSQAIWVEQQFVAGGRGESQPAPQPQPVPQPIPQPQPVPLPQPLPNPGWPWPQPPRPQPQWPQPQPPRPAPPPIAEEAGACFYSERNFRGTSFCVDIGDSFSRLRTWDNAIRSVEVFGGAEVDLCSDSNYRGSCATLRRDTARLPSELDRRASSIDVY